MTVSFSRILVAIDGSDTSMKAADAAISMAKKHGAKMIVVTAMDPYPEHLHVSGFRQYYEEARVKSKEESKNGLKK
jgi:nucleotide-binding universal stress UspA family protein